MFTSQHAEGLRLLWLRWISQTLPPWCLPLLPRTGVTLGVSYRLTCCEARVILFLTMQWRRDASDSQGPQQMHVNFTLL